MVTLGLPRITTLLRDLVDGRVEPTAREWLARVLETAAAERDRGTVLEAFTAATRRLGKATRLPSEPERARLRGAGMTWPLGGWSVDELGRITLLLAAAARWPEAELETLVEECYGQGDGPERQAVLRALPLLPAAERFLGIGLDAGRSHVQPLFEAIACENPYPARHFPELNFNQMVLKALFTGVPLERILDLESRVTPELRRMATAYASERRAAGRSVPPDIWRLTGERGQEP